MECISTPIIAHPDSDRDWDEQQHHVFSLPQDQKPVPYMPLTRNGPVDTKRRQVRHMRRHTVQNIRITGLPKRVRFDRSAIVKPTSTSAASKSTKTRKEWEELLKSSLVGLQGLYHNIHPPAAPMPAIQQSPVLGDRLPKPDLLALSLDHTSLAFRALQIASRSPVSPSQYQTEEYDGDMSSGSEDSYDTEGESPATPQSVRMGSEESMELDSGFRGMGMGCST